MNAETLLNTISILDPILPVPDASTTALRDTVTTDTIDGINLCVRNQLYVEPLICVDKILLWFIKVPWFHALPGHLHHPSFFLHIQCSSFFVPRTPPG